MPLNTKFAVVALSPSTVIMRVFEEEFIGAEMRNGV
jgi:hypothetical protein